MNEKELIKAVIALLKLNLEEHTSVNDNGTEYSVDLIVKDNKLDLHIEKREDEFENWVKTLDDELFQNALEKTVEAFDVDTVSEIEDKEELKNVFKNMVSKIATERIEQLKQYV